MDSHDSMEAKVGRRRSGRQAGIIALAFGLLSICVAAAAFANPPAAPATTAATDEALIREFEDLSRQKKTAADYDQFIAQHPTLLTATARPYGSALMWALEFERTEAVLALLRAGSAIPKAALTLAARGGLDEIVKLLLSRGARDDAEASALRAAAKYGYANTLKLLIQSGANVAGQASLDGFTALHVAVIDRRVEAVRVLIAAKAPLEARDRNGLTPLAWGSFAYSPKDKHLYEKLGQPHHTVKVDMGAATAMQLLLDAGARIDTVDNDGNTPLHQAAMLGSIRGAEALLSRGAKPNVKNRAGETPLSLAKQRNNSLLIELLTKQR